MDNLTHSALLEHVIELSRRMAATRELDPLLAYAMDEVLQLVDAERGCIVLIKPGHKLDFRVKRHRDGAVQKGFEDGISLSILNEVLQTNRSLLIGNAMEDARFATARSVLSLRLRSVICVPLITQNRTLGAIYVENRAVAGRFQKSDLPALELFASQAAVAIENATLNEELTKANEKLKALDEMKSNLVILVAHELRTPITTLYGYMGLLQEDPNPKIIRELGLSVNRVVRTINEIVDVFRIMAGLLNLELEKGFLAPLVEEVLAELALVCASRQLQVTVAGVNDLPELILDKKKIHTVLMNVIGNAVKYTPNGGKIFIHGRVRDQNVQLSIQDTGIGIPAEEQERIFDLFHVLGSMDNHSTSKSAFRGGGLGLGLPIAKGYVQAHQGDIWLQSPNASDSQQPGTTCFISLPRHVDPALLHLNQTKSLPTNLPEK